MGHNLMIEHLITRAALLLALLFLALAFLAARAVVVAWRDKNGNGVIDEGE